MPKGVYKRTIKGYFPRELYPNYGNRNKKKVKKITLTCQVCSKEFKVYPSFKNQKCCSRECADKARRVSKQIVLICQNCSKKFKVILSRKDARYCSKKCMSIVFQDYKLSKEIRKKISKSNKGKIGWKAGLSADPLKENYDPRVAKAAKKLIGHKDSDKTKRKRIETMKKNRIGNPNPNLFSCQFFKYFDMRLDTSGEYGRNEAWIYNYTKKCYYRPDYFNKEIKLIIEYDEEGHYNVNGELRECDKIKQKCIQERFPDFAFIRVRERNYFPDKKYFSDLTDEDLKVFEKMANDLLPQKSPFVTM